MAITTPNREYQLFKEKKGPRLSQPITCMNIGQAESVPRDLKGFCHDVHLAFFGSVSASKRLAWKNKTDMNSSASGWLVLTRNFVAGFHPQNDIDMNHLILRAHFCLTGCLRFQKKNTSFEGLQAH